MISCEPSPNKHPCVQISSGGEVFAMCAGTDWAWSLQLFPLATVTASQLSQRTGGYKSGAHKDGMWETCLGVYLKQ